MFTELLRFGVMTTQRPELTAGYGAHRLDLDLGLFAAIGQQ